MRRLALLTSALLSSSFLVALPDPAAASVALRVSVNFRDSLAPYGDWVQHERGQLRGIQQARREAASRPAPGDRRRRAQDAGEREVSIDKETLRARHEAEQKAQAEHEQHERQTLRQRHEREGPAVEDGEARPQSEKRKHPPKNKKDY